MTAADSPADSFADHPPLEHEFRRADGVDLHLVAAGDPADPLVVLLHGFPEFWYGWHRQLRPLVEAGYRVLVPDQRGYARSGKPRGVESYRVSRLSADVRALVASEGRESAHVVGHDWGAFVAWDLALRRPETVDRLAVVNVPHPRAYRETVRSNPRQLLRSWYAGFFQVPRFPEWVLSRDDFAPLARALTDGTPPGTFTERDLLRYRAAWGHERAVTAMLDWYRAGLRYPDRPPRTRVQVPTLVLWGEQDDALVPALAPASLAYCEDGRLERFPEHGHFLQHERPAAVTAHLLEHLDG